MSAPGEMTYDEVCMAMATKSTAKSKEQWDDFFSMSPQLQEAEARLVKGAVFEKDGPSVWDDMVAFLEVAAPLVGNVAGLVTGAQAIKGAL